MKNAVFPDRYIDQSVRNGTVHNPAPIVPVVCPEYKTSPVKDLSLAMLSLNHFRCLKSLLTAILQNIIPRFYISKSRDFINIPNAILLISVSS